ncbi:MAG: hypothetical protein A4E36_01258 [Methanoregulaceae archaeon PtaB.Bin009]|nr:MAG: hypothetical protein A4E36_01258 [Methanoregulaceae archaeon PtaB.Bin009]
MEWALSNKRTMNMRIQEIFAILLIAAGIFIAAAAADVNDQSSSEQVSLIGMANPSAVWAEQMGYEYLIRTNPDGSQYGVCVLPDGSERDSWELFRQSLAVEQEVSLIGLPDPSAVWASQRGYEYLIRTNPDGSQYGVCVLPDGSERDSWRTFREFCGISKPAGMSMIQPASPRAILSPKEAFGEAHFSVRLAALTP